MAMTKKDFEAMAEAMATARRYIADGVAGHPEQVIALNIASERLADACARQYKGGYGFDRVRFLKACGVE